MKSRITAAALVALTCLLLAGPAGAQETAPPAVSDPLNNYTLDALTPVRSPEVGAAAETVAKYWMEASGRYKQGVAKGRELLKTRLVVKEAELEALEARVKEAKASGDKTELERIKGELKGQKAQLDALEGIGKYAGQWSDYADSWERAGKAWLAFLAAEQEVSGRQAALAERLKGAADPKTAGRPSPEDFKAHKKLAEAYKNWGQALEDMGSDAEKLATSSSKVLTEWERRNLP